VITAIRADDVTVMAAAETLYDELTRAGIEVLLDDRSERPGEKFADAELIGIPYRVTVGPKGVTGGVAELTERRGMGTSEIGLEAVAGQLIERVRSARFGI
jgi:prolyl-tRNA synthetase